MFVNLSNYPSINWSKERIAATKQYGKVVDIQFPDIKSSFTKKKIDQLVVKYFKDIMKLKPKAVFVAGEWCFSFSLIMLLLKHKVLVLTIRAKRVAKEFIDQNGNPVKISNFRFLHYCRLPYLG